MEEPEPHLVRRTRAATNVAEGNALLYHFFQKTLLEEDAEQFALLTARLVNALGVWLPPRLYQAYPILVPFAVRDPNCRPNARNGNQDEWGSPNGAGYFRDDNSLVKGLPRSLEVLNPKNRLLHRRRLGTSFVASHVWRKLVPSGEAPRDRLTYSFLPNLVWLPSQLSKLSDREGGFVQSYLQAVSTRIYRAVPLQPDLAKIVDPIWDRLTVRDEAKAVDLPDPATLNYFEFQPKWFERKVTALRLVANALAKAAAGEPLDKKVVSTRYGEGLPNVPQTALRDLHDELATYLAAVT